MSARQDLSGQTFGFLKVIRRLDNTHSNTKKTKYLCKCICGNEKIVDAGNLPNGHTTSCGCWRGKTRGDQLKLSAGEAARNRLYGRYQTSARQRELSFELDLDTFTKITSSNCYYCNSEPLQVNDVGRVYGVYVHNGIDRIDNEQGYTIENSVPCCKVCNRAKGTLTTEEFRTWIRKVFINYASTDSPSD